MSDQSVTFGDFVHDRYAEGTLVVQPRMGFARIDAMREGLLATRRAARATVGTITVDSYTRTGDHRAVAAALRDGGDLNGFPLVAHGGHATRAMLADVRTETFPVQVRHGSPRPEAIVRALVDAGLDATEGGPVSYCLPYGRTALADAVRGWSAACRFMADTVARPHLETFGGCLLGQLCPPGLLVAVSVLEGMFFRQHGLRSVSLSYAQQTNPVQDMEAIAALHTLARELLPDVDHHVVVYTYMGRFPRTRHGATLLLSAAARLARAGGAARLIVKTAAEAHRIPSIEDNVAALRQASATVVTSLPPCTADNEILHEACLLIDTVLNFSDDIGHALEIAVDRGVLDIPYCVHPDNAGRSRSYVDTHGWLRWADTGAMPLPGSVGMGRKAPTASELLASLSYVERKFDTR